MLYSNKLEWDDGLALASRDHCLDIGQAGVSARRGTDGSSTKTRVNRYGEFTKMERFWNPADHDRTEVNPTNEAMGEANMAMMFGVNFKNFFKLGDMDRTPTEEDLIAEAIVALLSDQIAGIKNRDVIWDTNLKRVGVYSCLSTDDRLARVRIATMADASYQLDINQVD